jgi:Abnormal spindle-like microcephaly-assoc'd, ASPM-SPD-2-Hydin
VKSLCILLLAATMMLAACGGGASGGGSPRAPSLSGNWQFTVENPPDGSFFGGLQGGFLLQKNGSVTGGAVYFVSLQNTPPITPCNSGSAAITGTSSGQSATLTAVAGTQTFTFTGNLSSDGSTLTGTYTSTAGTASDGTPCGTAQTGLQWSAKLVPSVTGSVTGSFHSAGSVGGSGLQNQDFVVTGSLTQGENIGASNATVTGTLSFIDPATLLSDYPCLDTAAVNGQVSGNSVILQLIRTDGSIAGQIGAPAGPNVASNAGTYPVNISSTAGGTVLHSVNSPAYVVTTKSCPGGGSSGTPGDAGNICLAVGSTTACQQPITLSPPTLIFPTQILGSTPTTQTITLTNDSGATLTGLTLAWSAENSASGGGQTSFTGQPDYTEADNCAASLGSSFSLTAGQSCTIAVTFAPQESCSWLPNASGTSPARCPQALTATLTVNSPASADNDTAFAVAITGTGASFIQSSTPELDFGAEALSEASLPQLLSFTNHSGNPVQILHSRSASNPCPSSNSGQIPLVRPLTDDGEVGGLQMVTGSMTFQGSPLTVYYNCDSDPTTALPNFQISSDTCTGRLLASQDSCSLQVTFVPQSGTDTRTGLDYFLELNTLECTSPPNAPLSPPSCEIDSGRFPVELKANPASPLRMSPGAGLDFGNVNVGQASVQQTITLLNDPAAATTVNFVGKVVVSGSYSETDDCPFSLAPGSACTLTVTFKPKAVGFAAGALTINYTPNPNNTVETVYLRGTGQ